MRQTPDLTGLLASLADHGIDFIVVGGVAAVLRGVPITTFDLDVVHRRTPENLARIEDLFKSLHASSRLHPIDSAPVPGRDTLSGPGHQLLRTDLGPLDLLGAVERGEDYESLLPFADPISLRGREILVLRLDKLLDLKKDALRPKDALKKLLMEETLRRTSKET